MTLSETLSTDGAQIQEVNQHTDRNIILVPLHSQDSPTLRSEIWPIRCLTPLSHTTSITSSSVAMCPEAASTVRLDSPRELVAFIRIYPTS